MKPIPETLPDYENVRFLERPDGFYWQDKATDKTVGPFPSLLDAAKDAANADESDIEPGETIQEAESEIGIADWIDAETQEPAEEGRPRIEDDRH